jgi:anti-anti-sigma regulatory factor
MIERLAGVEHAVVLRVCGRIQLEHVRTLQEMIGQEGGRAVLDLTEVTLVGRDAVKFLAACELKGIKLRNCPAFLREWIASERLSPSATPSD